MTSLVPGLAIVVVIAAVGRLLGLVAPLGISEVTIGLVIGLVIANRFPLGPAAKPGTRFAAGTLLRLAIVLLGARLSIGQVLDTGGAVVLVVVSVAISAIVLTIVITRSLGTPPRLATLLGVGIGICGNSAIVATAPVIDADEAEVALAVTTITLFGTFAILAYPFIGHALALNDQAFGMWAGMAINDTSQVAAAGFAFSAAAGNTATIVKLTRNLLLGPLLVVIGAVHAGASGSAQGRGGIGMLDVVLRSVPPFVVGFLVLAGLNSLGAIPAAVQGALLEASKWLILMALVGIGLTTDFRSVRVLGLRPVLVSLVLEVGLGVTALALIVGLRLA